MTAAPSQKARRAQHPIHRSVTATRSNPALHPSTRHRQGTEYEESGRSKLTSTLGLDAKTIRIVSGPVSLRTLTFWGVVIFVAGFLHGKTNEQPRNRSRRVSHSRICAGSSNRRDHSCARSGRMRIPAGITQVTIRLVKFSPETIEVKTGQTVEWANNDLTPHTVTSQGTKYLSGSIDAGASWRHTFTQAGRFPYYCTFHPEMKGSVIVK